MTDKLFTPSEAAEVTKLSPDMQRNLRSRYGDKWPIPLGLERNGRWLFSKNDLIALTSYSMHLHAGTPAKEASEYAANLRVALEGNPNADAVTFTVGWPGDKEVAAGLMTFDPDRLTKLGKVVHYTMTINVAGLRRYVEDHAANDHASQ